MGSSIVFQLTEGGGPDPVAELERVASVAEDADGVSWIASRKPGAAFEAREDSRLLAFARVSETDVLALTARIVARYETLPSDALVGDMYDADGDVFGAYWEIGDVRLRRTPAADLPGTTGRGKEIGQAFRGSLSFAYWKPAAWPAAEAAVVRNEPVSVLGSMPRGGTPALPVCGVDFSGSREVGGRNGKIWIARWDPDRGVVDLECGGDAPGFGRAGLARKIAEDGGLWVLDFPFGPPATVAAAAGWATWRDYLTWCDGDPTALRDGLRAVPGDAGVTWSTRRAIDDEVGTTWFAFFEQMYRQMITGGRDVLRPLADAGRTWILPFDPHEGAGPDGSVVVEGFPGWTLKRCELPATGYKQGHEAARRRRHAIVRTPVSPIISWSEATQGSCYPVDRSASPAGRPPARTARSPQTPARLAAIGVGRESRRAQAVEDQIVIRIVADALPAPRRPDHHVAGVHASRPRTVHLHDPFALGDQVALVDVERVPLGFGAGRHPGPGDGKGRVAGGVAKLGDETALLEPGLGAGRRMYDTRFHGSLVTSTAGGAASCEGRRTTRNR